MTDKCRYSSDFELKGLTAPSATSFSTEETFVQNWLDRLPMANPSGCAQTMVTVLQEVNRLQIPTSNRLHFLDAVAAASERIYAALQVQYVQAAHPLPPRAEKARHLVLELLTQLVAGYKHTTFEYCNKSSFSLSRKGGLRKSLHAALDHLGHIATDAYHCRAPLQTGFWSDLHRIYAIAEDNGLLTFAPRDGNNTTIEQAYKRLLLLELASPYNLDARLIDHVYSALAGWSSRVSLTGMRSDSVDGTPILVDLLSDEPPFYPKTRARPADDRAHQFRIMRTDGLVHWLEAEAPNPILQQSVKLPKNNLLSLAQSWKGPSERSNIRITRELAVNTIIGMHSIHRTLESQIVNEEFDSGAFHFASEIGADFADPNFSAEMSDIIVMSRSGGNWAKSETSKAEELSAGAVTRDFSERGLRVQWHHEQGTPINVGDLIALALDDGAASPVKIGRICWIRRIQSGDTQAGVQLLAPYGAPILAQLCDRDGYPEDKYKTLLIPGIFFNHEKDVLVCPGLPFREGRLVRLPRRHDRVFVRLTEQLLHTRHFSCFLFEPVDPRSLTAVHETQARANTSWENENQRVNSEREAKRIEEEDRRQRAQISALDKVRKDW